MFLNYDGKNTGAAVGDTSISVANPDTIDTSVYAMASSNSPTTVYVVAINKTSNTLVAGISVSDSEVVHALGKAFVLQAGAPNPVTGPAVTNQGLILLPTPCQP